MKKKKDDMEFEYLTKELFKIKEGVTYDLILLSEFYEGKAIAGDSEPPIVIDIQDPDDSAAPPMFIFGSAVFRNAVIQHCPNNDHIGRVVRIRKGPKPAGKRYNTFTVAIGKKVLK